jgi:methionyl-tRNA synthetase
MGVIREGNRYLEKCAPWTLAKNGETERLNTVLYCAAYALHQVAVLLQPVMPQKMSELGEVLGFAPGELPAISALSSQSVNLSGRQVKETQPLFPRILLESEDAAKAPAKAEKKAPAKAEKPVEKMELITIDDFAKVELKTARIEEACRVEGADKLLKLQLDMAGEKRQIVSGIAESYAPETLIGKTIVVVSNLQPAKIRGVESRGMLLAAKAGKKIVLVTLDGEVPSGVRVG